MVPSIANNLINISVYTQINDQTVLFLSIQFSMSHLIWFGLVCLYGISTIAGYLMPNPFYTYNQFYFSPFFFIYTELKVKTILFQTIQFSINAQFSSIWPIDRTLSDANTPGLSLPGSDGNEGILRIQGHLLRQSYPLLRCSRCILQPQPTEPISNMFAINLNLR